MSIHDNISERNVNGENHLQLRIEDSFLDIGYVDKKTGTFVHTSFSKWRKFLIRILSCSKESNDSNITIALVMLILLKYHSTENTVNDVIDILLSEDSSIHMEYKRLIFKLNLMFGILKMSKHNVIESSEVSRKTDIEVYMFELRSLVLL